MREYKDKLPLFKCKLSPLRTCFIPKPLSIECMKLTLMYRVMPHVWSSRPLVNQMHLISLGLSSILREEGFIDPYLNSTCDEYSNKLNTSLDAKHELASNNLEKAWHLSKERMHTFTKGVLS